MSNFPISREGTYVRTYIGALGLSINVIHGGQHEHEPEKKREEQERVENHAVRKPSGSDLYFDELPQPFRRQYSHVPQTRRYVKLHSDERERVIVFAINQY